MNTKTRPPGHVFAKKHVSVTDLPNSSSDINNDDDDFKNKYILIYIYTNYDLKRTVFNKEVQVGRTDKRKRE